MPLEVDDEGLRERADREDASGRLEIFARGTEPDIVPYQLLPGETEMVYTSTTI
jgi:hypothetical protein